MRQVRAVGADVGQLEADLRKRVHSRDALKAEYAESQGRVKAHQEAMAACKKELTDPQYKGVDKRLSKQVVELKTYEMVNSDLDRYHGALDRALMAFHAAKMSDINKVVRELWQRTYRGQDIDYIQIRSDAEGAQGRSSYNYRVVGLVLVLFYLIFVVCAVSFKMKTAEMLQQDHHYVFKAIALLLLFDLKPSL